MQLDILSLVVSSVGGLFFFLTEWLWPLEAPHPFRDFAVNVAAVVMVIVAGMLTMAGLALALAAIAPPIPAVESLPPWLCIALFVLLVDALRYLVHRLMHRPAWWRVHRFHHSIEVVNWFSGLRASPAHVALFAAPLPLMAWLLHVDPVAQAVNLVAMTMSNHLMHTNTRIPAALQRALEWVFVTPRYHRPHHSPDPTCRDANFGSMFSFWDRLFGTYLDPDRLRGVELRYGLGEAAPVQWLRTALGR